MSERDFNTQSPKFKDENANSVISQSDFLGKSLKNNNDDYSDFRGSYLNDKSSFQTPLRNGSYQPKGSLEFTPLLQSSNKNSDKYNGSLGDKGSFDPNSYGLSAISEQATQEALSISQGNDSYDVSKLTDLSKNSEIDHTDGELPANAALTLREQEKVLEKVSRENFGLRIKIVCLEKRLESMAPEQIKEAVKDNVELHAERANLQLQLKRTESLLQKSEDKNFKLEKKVDYLSKVNDVEQSQNVKVFTERIRFLENALEKVQREKDSLSTEMEEDKSNKEVDYEYEIRQLQNRLDELSEELDVAQDLLTEKEDEIATLKRQIEEKEHSSSGFENEENSSYVHLQEDYAILQAKCDEFADRIQVLTADLEKEKENQIMHESEASIGLTDSMQVHTLQEQLHKANEEIEFLHDQISRMNEEGKNFEDIMLQFRSLEEERDVLESKLQTLEDDNNSLRLMTSSLGNQIESLRTQNREIDEEKNHLRLLASKNSDKALAETNIRLQEVTKELETLRMKNSNDLNEIHDFREENEGLTLKIDSITKEKDRLINELEQRIKSYEVNVSELNGTIDEYRNKLKDKEETYNEVMNAFQYKDNDLRRFHESINKLQDREKELTSNLEKKNLVITSLRETVAMLEKERESIKKYLSGNAKDLDNTNLMEILNDKISVLQRQLTDVKDELDVSEEEREEAIVARQKLSASFELMSNEKQALELKYSSLKNELINAQNLLDRREEELSELSKKLFEERKIRSGSNDDIEKNKEINVLNSELADKLAQIRHLESDKMELDKLVHHLNRGIEEANIEENAVKKRLCLLMGCDYSSVSILQIVSQIEHFVNQQIQTIRSLKQELRHDFVQFSGKKEQELSRSFEKFGLGTETKHDILAQRNRNVSEKMNDLENAAQKFFSSPDRKNGYLYPSEHTSKIEYLEKTIEDLKLALQDELKNRNLLMDDISSYNKQTTKLQEKIKWLERERSILIDELESYRSNQFNYQNNLVQDKNELEERLKEIQKELEVYNNHFMKQAELMTSNVTDESQLMLKTLREALQSKTNNIDHLSTILERNRKEYKSLLDDYNQLRARYKNLQSNTPQSTQSGQYESEIKGLSKLTKYLQSKCRREHSLRLDLAFSKKFILMQLTGYETCNKINLRMLQKIGISPDPDLSKKHIKLKSLIIVVCSIERMKRMKNEWLKQAQLKQSLQRAAAKAKTANY